MQIFSKNVNRNIYNQTEQISIFLYNIILRYLPTFDKNLINP